MKTSIEFACDGTSTTFGCPFPTLADSDVHCYLVSPKGAARLALNIDYTVHRVSGQAATQVLTTIAHPSDVALRCERRTTLTDLGSLHQLAYLVQELMADQERAAMVPRGEVLLELPPRAQRARRLLSFNANGDLVLLGNIDKSTAAWLQLMLADTTFENTGAGMVAYDPRLTYDEGSVGAALHDLSRRIDFLGG